MRKKTSEIHWVNMNNKKCNHFYYQELFQCDMSTIVRVSNSVCVCVPQQTAFPVALGIDTSHVAGCPGSPPASGTWQHRGNASHASTQRSPAHETAHTQMDEKHAGLSEHDHESTAQM